LWLAVSLLAVAALLAAWPLWLSMHPVPGVPAIDLDGADPQIAGAVQAARNAVTQSPRSAAAWGELAMVLHGNGLEQSADACYAVAADLDTRNPAWPYLRAYMHQGGPGGPEIAIPLYERAASLSPPNSIARVRLAEMLLAQGRLDDAAQEFDKVLAANPGDADAQLGLGAVAIVRRRYADALRLLEPLAQNPQVQKRACELLATAYARTGDQAAADRARQRHSILGEDVSRPDDAMLEVGSRQVGLAGRLRNANMLREQQQFHESLAILREAVIQYPNSDEAWATLGLALHQLRDPAGAEQAVGKSIRLAPKSAEYRMNLGMLQLEQKRFEEAAATFREAIDLQPTLGLAHLGLGESLLGLGSQAGAKEAFRDALRYLPGDETVQQRLEQMDKPMPQ
jgi:tetratricopeptide (TPR) repeat protein